MTEAAALELRHVRLAEAVTLRPAPLGPTPEGTVEDGVFVALDDSPPVRTVLAVVEGGRRRALEVVWVVEVAERDEPKAAFGALGDDHGGPPVRGFYGRWVADEALERAARVGTEHLEDGTPVVQPVVYDNSAVLDVSDTSMAMPAPVIVMDDDTGVVDTNDGEDDERDEAHAAGADDDGPVDPSEDAPTVSYDSHAGQTVEQAAAAPESADADESGETSTESAEASTDSGETPSESETSPDSGPDSGDAAAPAKGGRKKRGRKRR